MQRLHGFLLLDSPCPPMIKVVTLVFFNEVLSGVDWINLMVSFLLAQKIEKLET